MFLLNKRGQGLSLTIIIVAIIALIVATVLIMIFTGKIGDIREGTDDLIEKKPCPDGYGEKVSANCNPANTLYGNFDIPPGFVCCNNGV